MPTQLATSLTDNRASSSTTIFTAAMLALVVPECELNSGIVSKDHSNQFDRKAGRQAGRRREKHRQIDR